jgi:hypothetical protein
VHRSSHQGFAPHPPPLPYHLSAPAPRAHRRRHQNWNRHHQLPLFGSQRSVVDHRSALLITGLGQSVAAPRASPPAIGSHRRYPRFLPSLTSHCSGERLLPSPCPVFPPRCHRACGEDRTTFRPPPRIRSPCRRAGPKCSDCVPCTCTACRRHEPAMPLWPLGQASSASLGPVLAQNYSSFIFFQKSFFGLNSNFNFFPKFIEIRINIRKSHSKFL